MSICVHFSVYRECVCLPEGLGWGRVAGESVNI